MVMSIDEQLEMICEGTEEVLPIEDLKQKLKNSEITGKPLKVKLGLDPTAPDIHLGHTVVLKKLRQFQDLGHKAILLIGDFTAMVGDPSGKSVTRKQLSEEEVLKNAETYAKQAFKILDSNPEKIELVRNSEWLGKMNMAEVLRMASSYTVARILERDDFSLRYKDGVPISIVEFIYPLLQGMDSVAIEADIELGGTDQKFNLLVGRDLQKAYGQEPQVIITTALLEGIDGVQKMSKSLGNYIGVTESPESIFGKTMSIPDSLMIKYFRLGTDLTKTEIDEIEKGLDRDKLHPNEVKRRLGKEIVKRFYTAKAAEKAEEIFNAKHLAFSDKSAEDVAGRIELLEKSGQISKIEIPADQLKDGSIWIVRLIILAGFAKSNGEARRLIQQGGVRIGGRVIKSVDEEIRLSGGDLLQVGKRKYAKVSLP